VNIEQKTHDDAGVRMVPDIPCNMPAEVQSDGAAVASVGEEEGTGVFSQVFIGSLEAQSDGECDTAERGVFRPVREERGESGRSGDECVAETCGKWIPGAIAPGLRQGESTGAEDYRTGSYREVGGADDPTRVVSDAYDGLRSPQVDTRLHCGGEKGAQHCPGGVRDGEVLSGVFELKVNAEALKKDEGLIQIEGAEHSGHKRTRPGMEA